MKAVGFSHYGSPDHLEVREVPVPKPADDELLIQVHASSVNSWDWEFLSGKPVVNRLMFGLWRPKPGRQILGADVAGMVVAVGRAVTCFQPGDMVFGDLWDHFGAFAEFVCARPDAVVAMPEEVSFAEAAALPQAAVLARNGLRKASHLQPGQQVLINGAGGGVGSFAIQLARLAGAEVTGVDRAHKADGMRAAGADHVMDCAHDDFTRHSGRYDLIIDCQNYRPPAANRRALTPDGTYAMIGGSMARAMQLLWLGRLSARRGDRQWMGLVADGPGNGLAELGALLAARQIRPLIDRTYPLAQVPEALRYFGEGRHQGKISIVMDA
ncbi:MAG: NAD(P)-dependent alcohol dehydrogenase [Rhodocyclaceae bacterium]|nr:NAD(P)-dependent alcohol dehydrogenase [Rhodocyclaceae bacterium]